MNDLEFKKFYKAIDDKDFKDFYFLYGEEDYLIEKTYNYLLENLIPKEFRDFNFHLFYPEDVKGDTLSDIYEMYPMMAPRRVMVFKDVGTFGEGQLTCIQNFFSKPNELVSVIFLAPFIDKKKKIFKMLSDKVEKSNSLEFKKPFENQIPYWIKILANELKLEIEGDAIHLMHELIGGDLRSIAKELIKIKEFIHPKTVISFKDIQALVADMVQDNSFMLVEKWIQGNEAQQFKIVEEIVSSSENELGFLQLLARHLRILLQVKSGLEQKLSKDQLSKKNGIPSYFMEKYIKQTRHWSMERISALLASLSDVEMSLKKSPDLKLAILSRLAN